MKLGILALFLSLPALAADFRWVSVEELRSAQGAVGMEEVRAIREKIREKLESGEIEDYLVKKTGEGAIGPDGEIWVVNRNHHFLAARLEGVDHVRVKILADFSRLMRPGFLQEMSRRGWLWAYDESGRKINPEQLGRPLTELPDDPYRSLAKAAKDEGGYESTEERFADFKWANFFRARVDSALLASDPDRALEEAMKWAKSPAARGLPGYSGPR